MRCKLVGICKNISLVDEKVLGLGLIGRNGKDGWCEGASNHPKAGDDAAL